MDKKLRLGEFKSAEMYGINESPEEEIESLKAMLDDLQLYMAEIGIISARYRDITTALTIEDLFNKIDELVELYGLDI